MKMDIGPLPPRLLKHVLHRGQGRDPGQSDQMNVEYRQNCTFCIQDSADRGETVRRWK